jgi:hypothetical protein
MTLSALTSRQLRRRLIREEQGQGLVEFAFILPVFILILVGILEFGSIYSNVISLRQGVREAGRQGSVGSFGNGNCPVTAGQTATQNRDDLICLVKDQAGSGNGISAYVKFDTTYAVGNGLVICAVYPFRSLTGAIQPLLNHGNYNAKTKAEFRIESVPSSPSPALVGGGDADPSGQNWSWCA